MRVILYFLALNSLSGHPDRVRYVDPERQKEYEEYCRTHKGYKIPPDATPPPAVENNKLTSITETASDGERQSSTIKKESVNKSASNSNAESTSDNLNISSQVTRTSSSSSSSLPLHTLSPKFSLTGWLWSESAGWVYLSPDTYPYYYSPQHKKWLTLVLFK